MTDTSLHHNDHDHFHDPVIGATNTTFMIAVAANLVFAIIEATYALLVDSASLLADAGHNLGDVTGLLLAWGASYLMGIKSGRNFSYGYRRATILASIINALILVFASAFIAFESINKLFHPVTMQEIPVMVVATIGIAVNSGCALLFLKSSKHDLNIKAAYLHLVYDALISVGVVVTAVMIWWTGWQILDPLAGLLIGVIIIGGAWSILKASVNLILDAVPEHVNIKEVEEWLRSIDGVTAVHDVHVWGMSTRETGMTAHLVMPGNDLWESEDGFKQLNEDVRRRFHIDHLTLQIEKGQDCINESCCD